METRFVQGTAWAIAMRWAIRGVGLLSTLVLARTLTPADFGIVAMSSLVTGLLGMFLEMGSWQVLLRMGDVDRSEYDTAWTLGLIQALLLASIVVVAAYPASLYFKEPRLVPVMRVLAVGSVIGAFGNIGTLMFRRDLDFRSDFLFEFYSKAVGAVPTLILALIYRSYWSLVAGNIIGTALSVLVSYRIHPFRPRPSLVAWRRFLSFAVWITPASVANYLNQKTDVFIVGHVASAGQFGAYNVASELSRMATAEIVTPMARAVYPNFARLKDDLDELTQAFLMVLRTVCIISFACGFGIAAVATDAVYVILGSQWGFAVPLIGWLGIFGAFASIHSAVAGHILIVRHRERAVFVITLLRLAVFGASTLLAAALGNVVDVAMAAALSTGCVIVACLFYLPKVLPVSAARLVLQVFELLLAALVMFGVVRLLHLPGIHPHFVTLTLDVVTGAVVFTAILWLYWLARGRPDGPEARLATRLIALMRTFAGRLQRRRSV